MSDKKNREIIDGYDYLAHSASSNDCTGLIPSAPQSRDERDAYKDLYPFEPPKLRVKNPQGSASS